MTDKDSENDHNNADTSNEEHEESSCEEESSYESSEPEQRVMPSRSNRGSRMRFLLGNEQLIKESRADKGYKKLFGESDTSDSMNGSEAYSSASDTSSDSCDSDFDDEVRGRITKHVEESESSESADERPVKRQKKVPKAFQGRLRRSALKEGTPKADTDESAEEDEKSPEQSKKPSKAKKAPTERQSQCRQPGRNQAEKMASALKMRAHNLAVAAAGEPPIETKQSSLSQLSAKAIREKHPFFFYDASGYRTIEKGEFSKKYGSKTLYMFPMGSAEYDTLCDTDVRESNSPLEFLQHKLVENAAPVEDAVAAANPPSKYAYRYNEDSANVTNGLKVPYPLLPRKSAQMIPQKPKKGGLTAKSGKIVLTKTKPALDGDVFGCGGPYREPVTGIVYSNAAEYARIVRAVGIIQRFWQEKGYQEEWAQAWGPREVMEKDERLRHGLLPMLVAVVESSGK